MGKLSSRALALIVVLAAAAIAAYWYWSPHMALRSMRSAAVAGDVDELSQFVDYPKLRESMKGQFKARMAKTIGEAGEKSGFAALGAMIGMAMVDQMIDAMVRPEMLAASISKGRLQDPANAAASAPAASAPVAWRLDRKTADRVVAVPLDRKGPQPQHREVGFVFDREGFATWKLTEIRLPLDD